MAKNSGSKSNKPFYKKWWFWLIIVPIIIGLPGKFDNSKKNNTVSPSANISASTEADSITVEESNEEPEGSDNDNETASDDSSNPADAPVDISESDEATDKSENSIEVSSIGDSMNDLKDVLNQNENLTWFGSVRNDTTGKWRLSEYASGDSQESFAADYYKAFFENNDEIHAVINMSLRTTARLQMINKNTIDVTIMEYVEDEEHDANVLFGGTLLKEYWVYLDTGNIEQIQ